MSEETQKAFEAARLARMQAEGHLDELVGDPRDLEALDAEARAATDAIEKKKQELADAKEWLNDIGQRGRIIRTRRTPETVAKLKRNLEVAQSEERRLAEIHMFDEAGPQPEPQAPPPPPLPRPPTLEEWKRNHNASRALPAPAVQRGRDASSVVDAIARENFAKPTGPQLIKIPFAFEDVAPTAYMPALLRRDPFVPSKVVFTEGVEYFDLVSLQFDGVEIMTDGHAPAADFGPDAKHDISAVVPGPSTQIEIGVQNNDTIMRTLRGHFLVFNASQVVTRAPATQAETTS